MGVEFWDERYSAADYAYGTEPNEFFAGQIKALVPGRALFPAEGEGRNAVHAATLGWGVTAFDQSSEAKKKALMLARQKGVSIDYHLSGYKEFEYGDGTFDAAVLIFVHLPPDERPEFHRLIGRCISPGGTILLEGFAKDQIRFTSGGPKDEGMLFSVDEIRSDYPDFEIILLEQQIITLNEGPYHQGKASVIRFVGRKH
jgi:hypothetical protein